MASLITRRRCINGFFNRELSHNPTIPSLASKPEAAFDPMRRSLSFGGGFDRGHRVIMKGRFSSATKGRGWGSVSDSESESESDPDKYNKMIEDSKKWIRELNTVPTALSLAELVGLIWDAYFNPGSVSPVATIGACLWLVIAVTFAAGMSDKLKSPSFNRLSKYPDSIKTVLRGLRFGSLFFTAAYIVAFLRSAQPLSVGSIVIRVAVFLAHSVYLL